MADAQNRWIFPLNHLHLALGAGAENDRNGALEAATATGTCRPWLKASILIAPSGVDLLQSQSQAAKGIDSRICLWLYILKDFIRISCFHPAPLLAYLIPVHRI